MADWPLAGLSTPRPVHPLIVRRQAPPTLIAEFEDGTEIRRLKSSTERGRIFVQRWTVQQADLDAMLDFYETKGIFTNFSAVTYDANDPADTEVSMRFNAPPTYQHVGGNLWEATFELKELVGE